MDYQQKFGVFSGSGFHLDDCPARMDDDRTKEQLEEQTQANCAELAKLQYKLYAENRRAVLIVLQAMDAGGKDGVIRHVISPLNPQGCRVFSFKVPTPVETAHDFLWRYHLVTPARGEIGVFNRSHYESVLVEKVHDLASAEAIEKRYAQINDFESRLTAEGTTICKFFLHISKAEQLHRFRARFTDPDKQWKISDSDFRERAYWNDYQKAFDTAIRRCSTQLAPWYVIPSDYKPFRDLAVSALLLDTMRKMHLEVPSGRVDLAKIEQLLDAES
ncbi:MAG: hypothetical protein PHS41_02750 [Victivallaceae bacterium]|nr:hypothetical protein [Victivallaceae bacterium]